uniref:Putative methyltransferase n=2 Tax=viral metagenome TaxID=1070528 RepID=A0A6M3KFQ5_9ZZZZ
MMKPTYKEFLLSKVRLDRRMGFEIEPSEINPMLFPHQRDIVQWALRGGRRAIFAAFGLGKTFIQLEILRIIGAREGGRQLICAPLGVRQEFKRDAEKLGIEIRFIRFSNELGGDGIYITNYESIRDGRLDVGLFNGVTLDEAAVLRSYGSKTYQTFLGLFADVKYRFVATACPSPNRYKELIHYAGYLGVMDTGQALTRFFKRDSTQANNLTIHPHKEQEFWLWIASWAIFLQKPSDLGYSDEGYVLPELHVHYHEVKYAAGYQKDRYGQVQMFPDASLSATAASREKRNSIGARIQRMTEILESDPDSNYLLWHDQEAERRAIKKAVPSAVEVYGSQDLELREQNVIDFSDGKFQYLATKPILSGSGCNFQRYCHNAIFLGIGFKFSDFIQSVHRIHRFLQMHECHIHLIYAHTEKGILSILKRKWAQHIKMVEKMSDIIRKYGLSQADMMSELKRTMGTDRHVVRGKHFTAICNDSVEEMRRIETETVGLIHTSIPFANHYEYTPSYNDFGHTSDNEHFWAQMDYLIPELYRSLKPGRVAAIHVKDRIMFGNVTGLGFPSCDNMHEECSINFQKHGFVKIGMITVVTDVVRENNQTYRLGWTEQCKDGSKMGVGCPEYILIFRKPQTDKTKGFADEPVVKDKTEYTRAGWQIDAHAFWRSSGDRLLTPAELAQLGPGKLASLFTAQSLREIYSYEAHVEVGENLELKGLLPTTFMAIAPGSHCENVWHDVTRMRTLNSNQARRNLNMHICPLQFDIVDRIIERYSNKGDIVLDPFGGIMTVPYRAIKKGRYGIGIELSGEYWADGITYCKMAERETKQVGLFDYLKVVNE